LPALSEDLIGFEKRSDLGWSESEFSEWGGGYSVNSTILEILIRTTGFHLVKFSTLC